ncbi:transposase [candidate division KSB1 bacterium]|nr:transposase [candidate division KSB1 bacterium]
MSRRITQFEKDHYYHAFNRGANRNNIFYESKNYIYLLHKIKKAIQRYDLTIIAYCLMPNHYHFLIRQNGDSTISAFIQHLFNSYSKGFNKVYNRAGTLFEGKFKSTEIYDEPQLLHLCRYIHRNPIDCKKPLVDNLLEWCYSNYLEYIHERAGGIFDENFLKKHFPTDKDYIKFVMDEEAVKKQNEKYADLLIDYEI